MRSIQLALLLIIAMGGVLNLNGQATTFQDCDICPTMTVVPSGSITIGSDEIEIGRKKGERLQVLASIDYNYAIAQTEVTIEQYRRFVSETDHQSAEAVYKGKVLIGCNYYDGKSYGYIANHSWENPGYPQREDAPVVCVSWSDAQAYADWLTRRTGRLYRIPSTVEFEYASRGGKNTPWYWGTDPELACEYANIGDRTFAKVFPSRPTYPCEDGYVYTSSVGQFKPNDFGLYDMIGNAWEWTNDCYHSDLSAGPVDGSSWESEEDGDCTFRTPKGGSWISGISWSRSAVRSRDGAHYKSFMLGFRVAAEVNNSSDRK